MIKFIATASLLVLANIASTSLAFAPSFPKTTTTTTTTTAIHRSSLLRSSKNDQNVEDDAAVRVGIDRRKALSKSTNAIAAFLLSSTLVATSSSSPAFADLQYDAGGTSRTLVITGSNSGIGFDAAMRIAKQNEKHNIILACRTLAKATDAADRIKEALGDDLKGRLVPKECDLANLDSVRAFAKDLNGAFGDVGIDCLCNNAGLARNTAATDVLRTKQGFELTVGTNHLGHFLLTKELLPLINKNGKIVVTASGVHDPDSPGGAQGSLATLGDLAGLEKAVNDNSGMFDMIDGAKFDPDKAYKDSKLCNVFFTRELQKRLNNDGSSVVVNCFNPGLIVSTGFFRDQNPTFTKVFDFAVTNLFKVGETPHFGGGCLEYMTLDKTVGSKGGLYYTSPPGSNKYGDDVFGNQFTMDEVSKEARDDLKAKRLWELSEKLVAI